MRTVYLTLLAGAAFAARLSALAASPEPYGTDGYYYVVQAEHLLLRGSMHVPDASWVLQLFAGACALLEPILAVKVMSALLAAACVPAAYFAGVKLAALRSGEGPGPGSPAGHLAGLALAGWAAASPALTHLAGDFPKNLGAAAPLLLVLGWAAAPKATLRGWLAGVPLVLLAATAHRLGAALLGLAAVGALAGLLLRGARPPSRRPAAWRWPALVAAVAVAAFAGAALLLPNLLRLKDLARVFPQLDLTAGWPPPFSYFALRSTHPPEQLELAAPWLALALGTLALVRRPAARPVLGALLLPLAVCLLIPWRRDVLDLGYRLALLGPVCAAPLFLVAWPRGLPLRRGVTVQPATGSTAPGSARLPSGTASIGPDSARPARVAGSGLFALALLPLVLIARFGLDPSSTPPYAHYRALIFALPSPRPNLLIAHVGVNFLYDHLTGAEAMAWAPEPELDRAGVFRLAWGVRDGEWLAYCPAQPGRPPPVRLDADYSYVREDVWEELGANAQAAADDELLDRLADWRNPSRVRPGWMRR